MIEGIMNQAHIEIKGKGAAAATSAGKIRVIILNPFLL